MKLFLSILQVLSSCIYLSVVAVMDTIVLLVRCGDDFLREFDKIELNNQLLVFSDSTCRVYPFVFNFIFHLDRWLLVAMAIEGVLSVKYPNKVEKFCSVDRARAVILLLTVILVTVNLHYFWSFSLEHFDYPGKKCDFPSYGHQHSEEFQEIIWPIMEILVSEIFPRTAVFACAIIMAVKIYKGHHVGSKEHQAWQAKFTLDSRAIDQLKVLIMVVSFIFVFLTLPKSGYLIFRYLEENGVIDIVNWHGVWRTHPQLLMPWSMPFSPMWIICSSASSFSSTLLCREGFDTNSYVSSSAYACCRNISFRYQKQRGSFSQPLVRDSTYNSSLATTFDHLPQTVLGNDNGVQTSPYYYCMTSTAHFVLTRVLHALD